MRRVLAIASFVVVLPVALDARAGDEEPFTFDPPGALVPGSGQGRADETVYAPGMRFPIETGPAFANSQVWGYGGSEGPAGSQCSAPNYSYPWHDNYCETRSWTMPLCPSGAGHQGQDIRPPTCEDRTHFVVAAADGTVTNVGSYSIYVTAADGMRYDYLHSRNVAVQVGQTVTRGQRLSQVSNAFGGTPTTIHLHFNLYRDVAGFGFVYVSPYMSLVEAYRELIGEEPPIGDSRGTVAASDCTSIRGWARDPLQEDGPATITVAWGGPAGAPGAVLVELTADRYDAALCDTLGSCEHAFEIAIPMSLRDDEAHPVHVYAQSREEQFELESSPAVLACPRPALPTGVRRRFPGPEAVAAWHVSPFWDAARFQGDELAVLPEGDDVPERPVLVHADDDPEGTVVWLMDGGRRRVIADAEVAGAWGLDLAGAEAWPADFLMGLEEGPPLPRERFVVQDEHGVPFVIDAIADAAPGAGESTESGDASTGEPAASDGSGAPGSESGAPGQSGTGPFLGEDGRGCGCHAPAGARGVALPLLAVLAWARPARSRRPRRRSIGSS